MTTKTKTKILNIFLLIVISHQRTGCSDTWSPRHGALPADELLAGILGTDDGRTNPSIRDG
jgi:hypothetical protein